MDKILGDHMSAEIQEPERLGKKDKERIAELERVVKALVQAMQETENSTGDALMPVGTYFGVKFDE